MKKEDQSLNGKRILVTRAKAQAKVLSKKIKKLGGVPIEIPLIFIQPSDNHQEIKHTLDQLHTFDWLVFTSVNGIHYFFQFLDQYHPTWTKADLPKVAVVGEKTLRALKQRGISCELMPESYVGESLYETLKAVVSSHDRVLLARGNLARRFLKDKLQEIGVDVKDLVVYETVKNDKDQSKLVQLIKNKEIDVITFTSPSTVKYFIDCLQSIEWRQYTDSFKVACIGPITAQKAKKCGLHPDIVAKEYTIDGLLNEMIIYFKEEEKV